MASRATPPCCVCGACYDELRTGLTFRDVRAMLYRYEQPWRNKRRRGVLGFWRELKLQLWDLTHGDCQNELARAS